MMEAIHISETSVSLNEATRRYNPEGCHLQQQRALHKDPRVLQRISSQLAKYHPLPDRHSLIKA
jgi:hypothetical protein